MGICQVLRNTLNRHGLNILQGVTDARIQHGEDRKLKSILMFDIQA